MRVTGNSITANLVSQLNLLAARQARLQNQVATGQRIAAPEDDPAAMARALDLQAQSNRNTQYTQNIATLQNRAGVAGSAIEALKKISDRASELATRIGPALSSDNLQSSAVELRQLIQEAVHLANSQDGNQYVFAGTRSDQPPFTFATDSEGNVTAVTYQGNTNVAQNEIANGATIAVDAPGENNSGSGPRGVFGDSRYGADFFNHLISLQNHLMAGDANAVASVDRPALLHDEDNLIYQAANNGVVQSRLETASSIADTQNASLQQNLANVAGADLSTTIMQLSQTQNAYQLAIQSSAKLLQLQQSLLSALP
jgi:flagellar hook-associated protein 3 FlgL